MDSASRTMGQSVSVTNRSKTTTTTATATAATATATATATPSPLDSDKPSPQRSMTHIPSISASAVLCESFELPPNMVPCRGYDFAGNNDGCFPHSNNCSLLDNLIKSMETTGFQATNLGLAIQQIIRMRQWRLSDEPLPNTMSNSTSTSPSSSTDRNTAESPPKQNDDHGNHNNDHTHNNEINDDDPLNNNPNIRNRIRARIFLGYTSNQISSGQREVIKFLVQHKMVDVIVTTAGGIEEDLIKCFQPTYIGDFSLSGRELRKQGINRIGNLLVPNKNYCEFEDWITPLIERMHDEQDQAWLEWSDQMVAYNQNAKRGHEEPPHKFQWTPSRMIERLGLEINHEDSVLTWAARNKIPIFCPALTDGSIGDMLYFHSYKRAGFALDIVQDIRRINDLAVHSHATGMIVLGGGIVKHHICNANLMRNGADFSVFINTGQEFDGSDSGASPEEAISWGKIRINAKPVKVCADATIVFPLIVSQTFAKNVEEWKASVENSVCWVDDLDLNEM